ncbi:ATP-binding protein [Haloplanus halophilus]|uniref:ATP-binding protein n=1 Tax=Haloplanus halophilus TaxID=2949993 RepID=UPI0021115B5A|nr:PAS domain-containing sensor histidine kinase [Haloplanus sp. GDY1]
MPSTQFRTQEVSTLIDHLDETAIWIATDMGEFGFISDGFEEIWGIASDEIRDAPERLIETIHPDDRDYVRSQIEQSEEGVTEVRYEARIVRPDGEVRWLKTQHVPIRDDEGNLECVVGISTDITAQKRRERELEVLNRILRHDIRNDMTIMLGWAEILNEHTEGSEREYLDKIITSGRHVVELTEIARDYVEQLTSEKALPVKPTSLRPIVENELDLRRASYPDVEFLLDGDIPDVDVAGNELLGSVIKNLLNNAVQHNDEDDPVVTISFEVGDEDVVIRIADNGPGIPDERKESIFGKDEKGLDSSGTGIGLYLVQTLVDEYGGDVRVEDNESDGAAFVIRLPRAD